jgi:hypothetical protein
MCCFCNSHETIHHLFFDCVLAKFIWRIIQLTFGLGEPINVTNIYGAWAQNMNLRSKRLLYVGIGAMFWGMWLNRNDVIFNKTSISSYMQVIFRGTHWARTWALFRKEENRTAIQAACRLVETMTIEIFAKHGWWFSNRLSL